MILSYRVQFLSLKLTALIAVFFVSGFIFAETNAYLGINTSVSQWQMGLASGKTVQLFGLNQQSNKPDPALYMVGLSASIVYNKTWAITYQGEIGTAKPSITLSSSNDSNSPPTLSTISADTKIFRTDHSIAVSRTLGTTGFSVYAGAKLQMFGYNQPDGQYTETSGGTVQKMLPFSIEQNIINYGPAAGVTYMFRLYGKIFGALQAGLIYFPGQYTATMSFSLNPGQTLKNSADEKFYGLGATGLVSVIVPVSDGILLQVAARGQYYQAYTREGSATNQTTSKITSIPSTTMDNVQDILLGAQLAVICKLF
jgi:hypothetical protein